VVGGRIPAETVSVPPNLEFQVDDFENDWTFRRDSFDLIHSRLLLASVSDYPRLFRQALRYGSERHPIPDL
jgi:hypothetical protein